jgi:hypothetical protein
VAFRFAGDAEIGVLFVPPVPVLDTRHPVEVHIRRAQRADLVEDFAGPILGEGCDLVPAGSYGAVLPDARRQVRRQRRKPRGRRPGAAGALPGRRDRHQAGAAGGRRVPTDTEANDRWTFTLFAGDELDAGRAASGTVLKSRVRFRLGKPDRGIGSARVAPAVPLGAME